MSSVTFHLVIVKWNQSSNDWMKSYTLDQKCLLSTFLLFDCSFVISRWLAFVYLDVICVKTDLVKSVFKAPVPAYCLAQASALSAQAACGRTDRQEDRTQTKTTDLNIIDLKCRLDRWLIQRTLLRPLLVWRRPTILVHLLKVCLFLDLLAHVQDSHSLQAQTHLWYSTKPPHF